MLANWLKTIWSFWGIIIFCFLMFLALPFYLVAILIWKNKAIQQVHFISRWWAKSLLFFLGVSVSKTKPYPLSLKRSYVVIANHSSSLDIPVSAVATANPFKFLSKAELGKIPVLGFIIRNIYITVSRKNVTDRQQSFEKMQKALLEGTSIFIYPEGTRNRTSAPTKKFYDGAFKLAIETKTPIAVLTILNSANLQPIDKFSLKPGRIEVVWNEVIETKDLDLSQLDALKNKCQNLMNNTILNQK